MSLNRPVWKLKDWIDLEKLDWSQLSLNPNAIKLLEENLDKIHWCQLSKNTNGIELLLKNFDKIHLQNFAQNDKLPEIFDDLINKINWLDYVITLSKNKKSYEIFKKHKDYFKIKNLINCFYDETITNIKYNQSMSMNANELLKNIDDIDWKGFSANPTAIDFLEKNQDKINWNNLSLNPNAIKLLEENRDKINWFNLNLNESNEAIEVLEKNPDKIIWKLLATNPYAIDLLEKNQDKIDWFCLSKNPAIFDLDYKKMKKNNEDLYEELLMKIMEPSRIIKKIEKYGYDYIEIFR